VDEVTQLCSVWGCKENKPMSQLKIMDWPTPSTLDMLWTIRLLITTM
jgi:hypothetical protein